jgi:phosphopantetheinyl transferase
MWKWSLSDEERTVYEGDFTRMWCRKEAVAKMTGEGINGYPDYIDTTKYQFHEELIEHKGQKYWLVVV